MGTLTHVFVDSDTAFIAGLNGSDGKVSYLTGMSSQKPNTLDQTNLSHFAGSASEYTLTGGAVQEIFYDDGANSSMSSSSKYLYASNGTSTVYRFDMATQSNSVLSYDLSSYGISAAQDIAIRHPSSTETHLYVTDGGSGTAVKAFDISSGTASPLTLGGITTANDVYVHRSSGTEQAINFVTEDKLTTLPTTSQPNVFMSHFNMMENEGVAGNDLVGQLNGVQFTRTKNEVNDLVSGLNLKFKGTTQVGKSVGLTVDVDTDSIVTSVQDFVEQYNDTEQLLRDTVTARRIFNPKTDEDLVQGALANDVTLRGLYQRLVSLSVKPVIGDGEAKRLSDLGISRGKAGSVSISQIKQGLDLKVDEGRLRSAISSDPEGSASVFGSIAQLGTKAHRPVSYGSEAVLTLNTTDMATLREKIGKTLLIQDSGSNAIVPVTLSAVSGSSSITVKGGVLDSSDYSTYPGLVEIDGLDPIVISSIVANPSENKTVLKIDDVQGLNAIVARLNNTVNIRKGGLSMSSFSAGASGLNLDTLTFSTTDDIARFQYNSATLSNTLTNSTSTITVASTTDFDSSGVIRVDDEDIAYTGKTSTTFTGLTRGYGLTTANAHASGSTVYDGDKLVFKGSSDASGTTTLDHGEAITLRIRGKNTANKTLSVYAEKDLDKAVLVSATRHNGTLTHVETDTLTMTVTDVDTSNQLVTLEGFLDATLFNSYEYFQTAPPTGTVSTTKLVKIDGQTSNISVKSIIQAASNQSKIQLLSTVVGDYSVGNNIRLKQGNNTDDLRVTNVDNLASLNFSAVTLPTEGFNVNSDGVDTGAMGETQVNILGSDFRKFIGKSRVTLSNGSTATSPLPINRITSGVITGVTLPTNLTTAITLSHAATLENGAGTTGDISASRTTFSLSNVATLATSGVIKIDSEYITYTGKSGTTNGTLTGGTRAWDGSFASTAAATHTHADSIYANKHLATFGSTLQTLSLGDDPTHANYAKFAVRYGNARTIIELDTSYTATNLKTAINNISGVTAGLTATNKLYAFNNVGTDPITFEKLYGGTNLPDFLSLSELGSIYVSTPNKTPDLDGYSSITEVYEDTLTVSGPVTSVATGDLLVDGVAENVQSTLSSYTRFGSGLIGSRIGTIRDGLAEVANDMEVFDDRLVVKETELILEFAKLESALGSMQTQTQFLTLQLDSLQNTMKTISGRRSK